MGKIIDADALDDVVQKLNENGWGITRCEYKRISNVLFEFPTIEERKTGKWYVLHDEYGDVVEAVCSLCDINGNHTWKYCPNCGAKMEVDG